MTTDNSPDRWQQIERAYHGARVLEHTDRSRFLEALSASDAELAREVESLLRFETAAGSYLERPALEESARSLAFDRGPLAAGRRIAGYEVEELLGAGGMGEVYRARDYKLEREVALKVLERSIALDPAYLRRFEEEARAASSLSHPNIVTIYGVGEDEDLAFIAMELVKGRTMRAILSAGTMPIGDIIDIAVQLADALSAAHDAGIVHRDLKPENLMVTDSGLVKVLDFGIAKRREKPDAVPASDRAAILGTVGYMSPEQAGGLPADHRSDQFAFGAILCEMLCGRRAFDRGTTVATLAAIRTVAPESLPAIPFEVPAPLRDVTNRCLANAAADRYAFTRDLALELRQVQRRWREYPDRAVSRRRALWLIGVAGVVTAAGATWALWPSPAMLKSFAVLPFLNTDSSADLDYLCDGIADSLIRRLAYVPNLDVRSRSAAFHFKQPGIDAAAAGRRLGVDAVLTGSIARQSDSLVVVARVVDAASGNPTWTGRYERRATDFLNLEHDLATAIVDEAIRGRFTGSARRHFDREITADVEANDLYLRGLYSHRVGGERHYLDARKSLQGAVDRDPTFAVAHVSLASTYSVMAIDGFERPTWAWPRFNTSLRTALEIDPDLPEAHAEQSSSWFFFDRDWRAAEREWTLALRSASSPTLPDLLNASALKLWALGRVDDALALAQRSRALDPVSPRFAVQVADLLMYGNRLDDARTAYADVLRAEPENTQALFGLAQLERVEGRFDAAIETIRRAYAATADQLPAALSALIAGAHGENGYRAIVRAEAACDLDDHNDRKTRGEYVSPLDLARGYAQIGDRERAFEFLDAAFEDVSPGLVFLKVDRAWELVHDDERYAAALNELHLP